MLEVLPTALLRIMTLRWGPLRVLQSGGKPRASGPPGVFVDGQQVDPRQSLAKSPIREGCVVSLGDASGCRETLWIG